MMDKKLSGRLERAAFMATDAIRRMRDALSDDGYAGFDSSGYCIRQAELAKESCQMMLDLLSQSAAEQAPQSPPGSAPKPK